jgi:hypothetical protein
MPAAGHFPQFSGPVCFSRFTISGEWSGLSTASGRFAVSQVCAGFSSKSLEKMRRRKCLKKWSSLSESNRHLNLGKVRGVESNALERRHLADLKEPLIGK